MHRYEKENFIDTRALISVNYGRMRNAEVRVGIPEVEEGGWLKVCGVGDKVHYSQHILSRMIGFPF